MGIAEERTEGARTALSSADRFAKDFSSGPDFVNQTHGLSGIPTLLFSERFAPDELAASSRFLLVSSVKAIGPRAGVVGPLNELFRKTSPFARSR
jgi:hypothetical protein